MTLENIRDYYNDIRQNCLHYNYKNEIDIYEYYHGAIKLSNKIFDKFKLLKLVIVNEYAISKAIDCTYTNITIKKGKRIIEYQAEKYVECMQKYEDKYWPEQLEELYQQQEFEVI